MARTLDEIEASRPKADRGQFRATTEEDIRRHMIEDGQDPDAPLTGFAKRKPGQRGPGKKPAKVLLTLRVEPETLAAMMSTGAGWRMRAQEVLKDAAKGGGRAR